MPLERVDDKRSIAVFLVYLLPFSCYILIFAPLSAPLCTSASIVPLCVCNVYSYISCLPPCHHMRHTIFGFGRTCRLRRWWHCFGRSAYIRRRTLPQLEGLEGNVGSEPPATPSLAVPL